ncbi:MAG: hypothetical protein KIS80_00670 [Anaerolineales bacterium]|nr:hypothetical protein [Anaerolineales bacterium]
MKFRAIVLCALFLSACAPSGPSEAELHASAQALAASWLETEAAIPTATAAPSDTPEPSPTSAPSETAEPTLTESPTLSPAAFNTVTPFGFMEPSQLASAQANKDDQNAPLVLANRTDEEIRLQLLTPVYQEYTFTRTMIIIVPEGTYTYRAWIGGKGPRNGSFSITNGDKHELIFRENQINFSVP